MNLWPFLALVFVLTSCARVVAPPAPPVAPSPPSSAAPAPHFEKTFGSLQALPNGGLSVQYKKISLLIDPVAGAPDVDYVLLSGADARRWGSAVQADLRKNVKILCAPADAASVSQNGFAQVKALDAGSRILLKKEDGFLFVSATAGQSYFLEFDNGKNIFVGGDIPSADSVRNFLYSLRDDGRSIEIGFFKIGPATDNTTLAQIIGLLQPKNAVLLREPNAKTPNLDALREQLKDEFFEDPIAVAGNETMPF